MAEFLMPSLGADMEAGTLVKWRRAVGDRVERDDIIAEVETDKGLIEIEVFTSGVIEKLLVTPGEKIPVGTPMAIIHEGAMEAPAAPPKISPRARKRAQELGVDLSGIHGSGPGGVIEADDVERAAGAAPEEMATSEAQNAEKRPDMRRAIAAAMGRSKREIPHFYLATTIDMGRALEWLERENMARSVAARILSGVLLLKATALALRKVPELNARREGEIALPAPGIHLGVAISLRGGGLVAPAIHDADRLSLDELMSALGDLISRARAGTLRSSEMTDPTMTVTSLGERGVETVFPIIFLPQVAIVGFGRIVERPWVVGGVISARPLVNATLAADHRVTDGHRAARLLAEIDALLQTPERL